MWMSHSCSWDDVAGTSTPHPRSRPGGWARITGNESFRERRSTRARALGGPRSGGRERPAHSGQLDLDRGVGRHLLLELPGELPGFVLVGGAEEEELPAARLPGPRLPACAPARPPADVSRARPGPPTGPGPWPATRPSRPAAVAGAPPGARPRSAASGRPGSPIAPRWGASGARRIRPRCRAGPARRGRSVRPPQRQPRCPRTGRSDPHPRRRRHPGRPGGGCLLRPDSGRRAVARLAGGSPRG
jgi:hypothetical protein